MHVAGLRLKTELSSRPLEILLRLRVRTEQPSYLLVRETRSIRDLAEGMTLCVCIAYRRPQPTTRNSGLHRCPLHLLQFVHLVT